MEQVMSTVSWFNSNWQGILFAVTSIVTGASVIAKLTPTKIDDEYLAKAVKVIDWIAMNKSRLPK